MTYTRIERHIMNKNFKAVLSTTILPIDGNYCITTVDNVNINGIPSYIGHPSTKEIVEKMGAVQASSKLFTGLQVGEIAVAVSIKQGMSSRVTENKTVDQDVNIDMLTFRTIRRMPDIVDELNRGKWKF